MPLHVPRSTVRSTVLAVAASAALTAVLVPAAPARPADGPRTPSARPAAPAAAVASARTPDATARARRRARARAARRRAAAVERGTGRAHLPQQVRRGRLPAARAPLAGLLSTVPTVPAIVTPVVGALTGAPGPAPAPSPTPPPAGPVAITSVGIELRDTPAYSATLSRATVPAGPVRLQLQNAGEDPHDLEVRRADDGSSAASFTSTDPGSTRTKTLTLPAGSYRLFCTFTEPVVHADAGMRATLVVSG